MSSFELNDLCQVKDALAAITQIEARLKKETGLNLNQSFALCCLARSPLSAAGLATELKIAGPSLSRVIKTLYFKGLIFRDLSWADSRQKVLSLTPDGQKLAATLKTCEEGLFPLRFP